MPTAQLGPYKTCKYSGQTLKPYRIHLNKSGTAVLAKNLFETLTTKIVIEVMHLSLSMTYSPMPHLI